MAFGVIHHFPGGTKEQYEATLAAVHPADGSLPPGQTHHAAGPTDDGWVVVALHDSRATWERFRDETLMPALAQGIEGAFQGPPQETTFETYTVQTA